MLDSSEKFSNLLRPMILPTKISIMKGRFQTNDGHYLYSEKGGGRECRTNRAGIGNWAKFYLVHLPDAKVALKTYKKGKFVSGQKNS
jgi:hypothetical protein